jgi:hypothetical protein
LLSTVPPAPGSRGQVSDPTTLRDFDALTWELDVETEATKPSRVSDIERILKEWGE